MVDIISMLLDSLVLRSVFYIIRHRLCGFIRSSGINSFVMLLVFVFESSLVSGPSQLLPFILQAMGKSLLSSHQTSQSETALLEVKWKHIVEQLLHSLTITSNFERFHGGVPKARALWCAIPCSIWVWISREKQIELQQPMK